MQKLQLKDGTKINILDGSTENNYQAVIADMTVFGNLYNKLTDTNLSKIKVLSATDSVTASYTDKTLDKIYPQNNSGTLTAVILLKPADVVSKNIKDLQTSQQLQNQAILDIVLRMGV